MRKIHALVGVVVLSAAVKLAATASEPTSSEPATTGSRFVYTVQQGETLTSIGARFGIDVRSLARLNGVPPDGRIAVGRQITIDSRHILPESLATEIVINIPQRMLFLFTDGRLDSAYPVGLGRPSWPTFTGNFTVAVVEPDPTWDVPQSIQEEMRRSGDPVTTQVPPGPNNPLGTFWIGLSRPGFGIHGTNAPSSVFRFQTHGCVRLHPDDINTLAMRVTTGLAGRVVYEPVLITVGDAGAVLIEVHPDIYRRVGDLRQHARRAAERRSLASVIDWTRADAAIAARDGIVTDVRTIAHVPRSTPRAGAP